MRPSGRPRSVVTSTRSKSGRGVLSDKLTPKDFGKDGNPVRGPWADVLADLDAWAAKYKVDIWTTDHRRDALGSTAGAAPVPMAATSCPGTTTSTERSISSAGTGSPSR
jgi:hypothetical protein